MNEYDIHTNLKIKYGSLLEELSKQQMICKYLTGNEKVLELGGNIGRNSIKTQINSKRIGNNSIGYSIK